MEDFDLGGLGRVLADPERVKVFHDGEYDVLILKRQYGWSFASLFDTRVAAAAMGCESPGLASVLAERFDVELDKSMQRSNWSSRPLTERQIDYARLDTHYLVALMHELQAELERTGRTDVVAGECRRLEALEPPVRDFNPDEFVRLKGARKLDAHQLQALRSLFVLRDRKARERDVPPFKVLANPALIELARVRPSSMHELANVPDFPGKLLKRMGPEVLAVVREARELGPLQRLPQLPARDGTPLDETQQELHERLKTWRKEQARREGMDASLVLNRHVLTRLAIERPRSPADLSSVEGLLRWQTERFGDDLLALVEGFERDLSAGRIDLRHRRSRRR
jgi:ribonuclease D